MTIFISSIITGLEDFRNAALRACQTLKYQVLRAEDFGANAGTPQQVCLAGVRAADVVVLILGARYGEPQSSGLSPTHEEFREAREGSRVLAFVQEGVTREPRQEEFVREVQSWGGGLYTASFTKPDELRDAVIEALHREEIARGTGPVDEAEMLKRAQRLVPDGRGAIREPSLCVVIAGGPKQQILRPAELEKQVLHKKLMKEALFGDTAVLNPSQGSETAVVGDQLSITQDDNSITLDQMGAIRIVQALRNDESPGSFGMVLIEEDIQVSVKTALVFGGWVWDSIDDKHRLTHAVPVVSLLNAGYKGWKTRDEQRRDPNRATLSMHSVETITVKLSPVSRPRPALNIQALELAEDFTTLLRREFKK